MKAMKTRFLSTAQCVVYVIQKDGKLLIDWAAPTTVLGGQEVCVGDVGGWREGEGGGGVRLLHVFVYSSTIAFINNYVDRVDL